MELQINHKISSKMVKSLSTLDVFLKEVSDACVKMSSVEDLLTIMSKPGRLELRSQLMRRLLAKLAKANEGSKDQIAKASANEGSLESISRCDDMLWYKVYYDPLAKAKKLKKPELWDTCEAAAARLFIEEGIKFYLKLIEDLPDASIVGQKPLWHLLVHCLSHLGDLSRYYCLNLGLFSKEPTCFSSPAIYYMQALELRPKNGLIHSNLAAVLLHVEHNKCSAVLQYLSALMCKNHQQAKLLLKPILNSSVQSYQSLLNAEDFLVLRKDNFAKPCFSDTLMAVIASFLPRSYDPYQLQMVCRNFLLHFDELLKEVSSGESNSQPPVRHTEALVPQTCAIMIAVHEIQFDERGKTCSVLLASILLAILSYLNRTTRLALSTCCSPAAVAALASPSLAVALGSPGVSDESAGHASGASTPAPERAMQRRRVPRRRRRVRKRPQMDEDDSSCEEDGAESNASDDGSSVTFSDALCSSSEDSLSEAEDSGPDAIIETDSADDVDTAPRCLPEQTPNEKNGLTSPVAAENPVQEMSALQHLRLLTALDDGSVIGIDKSEHVYPTDANGKDCQAPGMLLAAKLVLSWLLSSSSVAGDIVWCDPKQDQSKGAGSQTVNDETVENNAAVRGTLRTSCNDSMPENSSAATNSSILQNGLTAENESSINHEVSARSKDEVSQQRIDKPWTCGSSNDDNNANHSSGAAQGVRIMWQELATLCNLLSLDLQRLCSEDNREDLPNLDRFMKSVKTTKAFAVDAWCEFDDLLLPEDDELHSTLPEIVPEHVLKEGPIMLCGHLSKTLERLGIHRHRYHAKADAANESGCIQPPRSILTSTEVTLIRILRLRRTVYQLTRYDGCPLKYNSTVRAFFLPPTASDSLVDHKNDYEQCYKTADGRNQTSAQGFYHTKNAVVNEYFRSKTHQSYPREKPNEGRVRCRHKLPIRDGHKPGKKYRPRPRNNRDHKVTESYNHRASHYDQQKNWPPLVGKTYRGFSNSDTKATSDEDAREILDPNSYGRRNLPDSSEATAVIAPASDEHKTPSPTSGYQKTMMLSHEERQIPSPISDSRKTPSPTVDKGISSTKTDDDPCGDAVANNGVSEMKRMEDATDEEKRNKRVANQRLLTEQWLRHELSCAPKGTAATTTPKVVVCDSLTLSHHRGLLTALMEKGSRVMVPLQVVEHLDELKRHVGAARDASRWLELQLRAPRRVGGDHPLEGRGYIRLQGPGEHLQIPGVQYPAKQHKMPWRWYQILDCCHHFARLEYSGEGNKGRCVGSLYSDNIDGKSRPSSPSSMDVAVPSLKGKKPVVTLLTGETKDAVGKLPFSVYSLAASVGTEVRFATDLQKTIVRPSNRERT
ncbi:uncharacterized protein LOC108664445 [Hyalella azteca]|uniref:Uncharacterized protein LOC108664445 n=1 Tax=Hyalella azteca TaxID=294128 RepID=A0A8B7MY82_HYAAZ|nr:uncharacterized protein LOC108664445 [Hyalella azteca]